MPPGCEQRPEDRGPGGPGLERGGLPPPADRPPGARTPHVDSRAARARPQDRGRSPRPSSAPRCRTSTARSRSCWSASTRCAMPILDLRLRKACGARRPRGDRLRAPDGARRRRRRPCATPAVRHVPRGARGRAWQRAGEAPLGPEASEEIQRAAGALRPGSTVVVYGERVGRGPDGDAALRHLLACADALRLSDDGAGLLEVPETANARGLREVGCLPSAGPASRRSPRARNAEEIKRGLIAGEIDGLILWDVDPLRATARPDGWMEALAASRLHLRDRAVRQRLRRPRGRLLPGRDPRREGGHGDSSDGRLQRVRQASHTRARRATAGSGSSSSPRASTTRPGSTRTRGARGDRLRGAVLRRDHPRGDRRPGVRWQEREAARALAAQE